MTQEITHVFQHQKLLSRITCSAFPTNPSVSW